MSACFESSGIGLKGWPDDCIGKPLSSVVGKSLRRDELMLPAAVIRWDIVEANSRWMQEFQRRMGVNLAPHGKTSMSPELITRQMEDGAWGMTAANAHHARIYAAIGVRRILIANQIIGAANIEALLNLRAIEGMEIMLLVDCAANAEALSAAVLARGQEPLDVLVEMGDPGQRAGVRSVEAACDLARHLFTLEGVALRGVECFEGVYVPYDDAPKSVASLLSKMIKAAHAIDAKELFAPGEIILTAGGSAFFDQAVRAMASAGLSREPRIIIRSGCYLAHDSKLYDESFSKLLEREPELADMGRLRPAVEVWAHIQSRPEPTRAYATLGKRDISDDAHRPVPVRMMRPGRDSAPVDVPEGMRVIGLNDQHGFIELPEDADIAVGDLVAFGCSHPCTTFDKWKVLYVIDDQETVTGTIRTVF